MWDDHSKSEELICRELLDNGSLCVSEISNRTNLPTWKVSRNLKRLEIRGLVSHEVENRNKRGRPRKFYKLKPKTAALPNLGGESDE